MPTAAIEYENKELYKRQEKGKGKFRSSEFRGVTVSRSTSVVRIKL